MQKNNQHLGLVNFLKLKEKTMSNFIYVNPALINPKTKENQREIETQKLLKLKQEGYTLIGLEMTEPTLASLCDINIDPQHTDQKTSQSCVKEIFQNFEEIVAPLTPLEDKKIIFLTNRVDLDSIASYVVFNKLANKKTISTLSVKQINAHDTFKTLPWEKEKNIEEAFNPFDKTKALASTIKPFMVTESNIKNVETFLDNGSVDENIMASYQASEQNIINKVKSKEINVSKKGGIAFVETTLPCATDVGYCYAPIVIAINPQMRSADGYTYRKVSICQHEEGYVDLKSLKEILQEKEQGWGGSPTFIGSPQGTSTNITKEELQKLVYKHLTKDYKQRLAQNQKQNTSIEL